MDVECSIGLMSGQQGHAKAVSEGLQHSESEGRQTSLHATPIGISALPSCQVVMRNLAE